LFEFLNWFLKKSKYGKFNLLLSHYKIYRVSNNIFINFYYYNVVLEEKRYDLEVIYLLNLINQEQKSQIGFSSSSKELLNIENYYISTVNNSQLNDIKSELLLNYDSLENFEENIKRIKIKNLYKHILKVLFSNLF
jgi:hypothetical protein